MSLEKADTLGIINNSPRARAFRHIQEWILDGRLAAGSRLPSELRLASKLNVSRTTIRLALEDLEKDGMIQAENRVRIVRGHVQPQRTFLSDSIALIMEPPHPQHYSDQKVRNTWHFNFIHAGAVQAIRLAGYDALTVHPDRIAGDLLQRLIQQRPAGAIVLCGVVQDKSGEFIGRALRDGNIPFVIYGDMGLAQGNPEFAAVIDSVVSDHELGAYTLTKWLINQGRKRILRLWQFPGMPDEIEPWIHQRNAGHEHALEEAGLQAIPPVHIFEPIYHTFGNTELDFRRGARLMAGYLVEHLHGPNAVDAIMAPSDALVGHLCAALRLHGLRPNEDILLVGYDNMWDDMETRAWEPLGPLATVDKKNLVLGSELMALLKDRIEGKLFKCAERRTVEPEMVVRPSAFPTAVLRDVEGCSLSMA